MIIVLYIGVVFFMSIFLPIQETVIYRDTSGIHTSNIVRYEFIMDISSERIAWPRLILQWIVAISITVILMYVFKTKKQDTDSQLNINEKPIEYPIEAIIKKHKSKDEQL